MGLVGGGSPFPGLTIISIIPYDGSPSVPIDTPVTATLSEPVVIEDNSLTLRDANNNPIQGTIVLSADGKTLTFNKTSNLAHSTTYIATITRVKDLAGNSMSSPKTWTLLPDKLNCRFTVLYTCEKVIGIVHGMTGTKQSDGDYEFNLFVQEPYKRFLNPGNYIQVNGMIVIEIIPKDQNSKFVQIPKNGDKIEAYGPWVTDNPHGWNELHPAWKVKVL